MYLSGFTTSYLFINVSISPQVTEETGDETQVDVQLSEASRGSPKPSHVTSVEETHEVIVTREDVTGFTEEETIPEQVEVTINFSLCDNSMIKVFLVVCAYKWDSKRENCLAFFILATEFKAEADMNKPPMICKHKSVCSTVKRCTKKLDLTMYHNLTPL